MLDKCHPHSGEPFGWRDKHKHKGERRDRDPATIEIKRLKNSSVRFNQTDRNPTLVRAEEMDGVSVHHNVIKNGPAEPPTGRSIIHIISGAQLAVLGGVRRKGSGIDSLVGGADAEYLSLHVCTIETVEDPPEKRCRTVFLPSSACFEKKQPGNTKHVGPNERCPCESGKILKHCHGELK